MQQLSTRRGNEADEVTHGNAAIARPVALPSTLPLRDWLAYHAENMNQISSNNHFMGYKRIDKRYLENSTRVALSLAKKLDANHNGPDHNSSIRSEDIIIENIVVTNTSDGEVDFVNLTGTLSNNTQQISQPSQREAIFTLGSIFYEVFTQGLLPSSTESEPATFDLA